MYDFSVSMALVDFIPVACFGVSAALLLRDLYYKMPKYGFAMLAAGTINVFAAGFLKALWKLLYALGICNFELLSTMFLPTQSLGFLLAGVAMLALICDKKRAALAVAPPVFGGKALFIVMMVAGLGYMCAGLSVLAARAKKKGAIALFALSFVASMGMGYAGRLDGTLSWVNWLEQGINIVSQASLLAGVLVLHKVLGRTAGKTGAAA